MSGQSVRLSALVPSGRDKALVLGTFPNAVPVLNTTGTVLGLAVCNGMDGDEVQYVCPVPTGGRVASGHWDASDPNRPILTAITFVNAPGFPPSIQAGT